MKEITYPGYLNRVIPPKPVDQNTVSGFAKFRAQVAKAVELRSDASDDRSESGWSGAWSATEWWATDVEGELDRFQSCDLFDTTSGRTDIITLVVAEQLGGEQLPTNRSGTRSCSDLS